MSAPMQTGRWFWNLQQILSALMLIPFLTDLFFTLSKLKGL